MIKVFTFYKTEAGSVYSLGPFLVSSVFVADFVPVIIGRIYKKNNLMLSKNRKIAEQS